MRLGVAFFIHEEVHEFIAVIGEGFHAVGDVFAGVFEVGFVFEKVFEAFFDGGILGGAGVVFKRYGAMLEGYHVVVGIVEFLAFAVDVVDEFVVRTAADDDFAVVRDAVQVE